MGSRFAENVASQSKGELAPEQLECLRDGYAGLSDEEIEALTLAGLSVGSGDSGIERRLDTILATCGVERHALQPAGIGG